MLRQYQKMTYKTANVTMPNHVTAHLGATGRNATEIVNKPEYVMQMILLKKLKIEIVLNFAFSMWRMKSMIVLKHVRLTIIDQIEIKIRDY